MVEDHLIVSTTPAAPKGDIHCPLTMLRPRHTLAKLKALPSSDMSPANSSCFNTIPMNMNHDHAVLRHGNPLGPAPGFRGKPSQGCAAGSKNDVVSALDSPR